MNKEVYYSLIYDLISIIWFAVNPYVKLQTGNEQKEMTIGFMMDLPSIMLYLVLFELKNNFLVLVKLLSPRLILICGLGT